MVLISAEEAVSVAAAENVVLLQFIFVSIFVFVFVYSSL